MIHVYDGVVWYLCLYLLWGALPQAQGFETRGSGSGGDKYKHRYQKHALKGLLRPLVRHRRRTSFRYAQNSIRSLFFLKLKTG